MLSRNAQMLTVYNNLVRGSQARDYMPGDEFNDNRWRNAWNAVYVAGGWRLVQPNWAAMQVNTKVRFIGRKNDDFPKSSL